MLLRLGFGETGLCRAGVLRVRPGPTHTSSVRVELSQSPGQQENLEPAWTATWAERPGQQETLSLPSPGPVCR